MTTWKIDPAHTDVNFSAKHMMVTTVRGKFGQVDGSITLDDADLTKSRGDFRVEAVSVSTGVERRDQHLRSADFFDVETYPAITFVSTGIVAAGTDRYAVTGDLTIKDVTKSVSIDFAYNGSATDPYGNQRVGFDGSTVINRKDFGVNFNAALETGGVLVSDKITLELELSAIKTQPTV